MKDKPILSKKSIENNKYKEIKKPHYWTEKEDEILKEKAKEFNYKNWNSIAKFIPGRTSIQCSARFRRIKPGLIKGAWGKEEDSKLLSLYKKYGRNWAAISKEMPHRTGKQIRDRFLNSLDTKYDRGKFTKKEDNMILKYYKEYGNSWARIAKKMKTRTGDMVKNRFYSSLKKKILNNKDLLKKKRKRFTSKFKNKSKNNKHNSEIKIKKEWFQIRVDRNKEKNEKKNDFIFKDKLNNSLREDLKIINQKNKVNIINNTNIICYDPIYNTAFIDKYVDEINNASFKINEEKSPKEFNENLNSCQLFIDNENKIKNINKIYNNNSNNNEYSYLDKNLVKNEIMDNLDFNDNAFNSKFFLELNETDNENVNYFLNQKYEKNEENLEKLTESELDLDQTLKEKMDIIFNPVNIKKE